MLRVVSISKRDSVAAPRLMMAYYYLILIKNGVKCLYQTRLYFVLINLFDILSDKAVNVWDTEGSIERLSGLWEVALKKCQFSSWNEIYCWNIESFSNFLVNSSRIKWFWRLCAIFVMHIFSCFDTLFSKKSIWFNKTIQLFESYV